MATKARCDEIRGLKRRLRDESLGDEQTLVLSGSLEELNINPDVKAARPQSREAARAGQT